MGERGRFKMKTTSREDRKVGRKKSRTNEFGYSIIEIVFVVALVAILGNVAVTQLKPSLEKYRLVSSANMIASEMNAG